ncbi:MAG: DUF6273 domain-containing protein [Treponema sp.]|nr:DUF6273 domain-containing protein [Treponema sp.]
MRRVLFYITFFLIILVFNSCTFLNERTATLSFSFDPSFREKVISSNKFSRALDDADTGTESDTENTSTDSDDDSQIDIFKDLEIYVDIEVSGDYQNTKTLEIKSDDQMTQKIIFSDLTPNLQVYVTGSVYAFILENKVEFYNGKTDSIQLHEGVNDIALTLNKLELQFTESETDTETEKDSDPANDQTSTNESTGDAAQTSDPDPASDPSSDPSSDPTGDPDPTSSNNEDVIGGAYTPLPAGTSGTAGSSETYVTFGMWPQTIKAADVEVDTTNEAHCGVFTYCKGSDGEWYYLHTEDLYYTDNTTYSNGEKGEEGRESWFKVEPIMWRVISDYDDDGDTSTPGKTLLVAEKVIYSCEINDDDNARGEILANNYKESRMRAFLNGYEYNKQGTQSSEFVSKGFLQTAFDSTLLQMIETVTVRNGVETGAESGYECEDTQDKVFLLTKNEGNDSSMFPDSSLYKHYCTDFALATSISQATSNTSNSEIWLRTPTVQSGTVCSARIYSSSIYNSVPSCSLGFFPAICISE